MSENRFGKRLQRYRKVAGFRSVKDFANAMSPESSITASVLESIESADRPRELKVREIFTLAEALKISPIYLLIDVGRPLDPLDVVSGVDKSGMDLLKDFDVKYRDDRSMNDLEYSLAWRHSLIKEISDSEWRAELWRSKLGEDRDPRAAGSLAHELAKQLMTLRALSRQPSKRGRWDDLPEEVGGVWQERSDKVYLELRELAREYELDLASYFDGYDLEVTGELGPELTRAIKLRRSRQEEEFGQLPNHARVTEGEA